MYTFNSLRLEYEYYLDVEMKGDFVPCVGLVCGCSWVAVCLRGC